jgi:hypothetical protein
MSLAVDNPIINLPFEEPIVRDEMLLSIGNELQAQETF